MRLDSPVGTRNTERKYNASMNTDEAANTDELGYADEMVNNEAMSFNMEDNRIRDADVLGSGRSL